LSVSDVPAERLKVVVLLVRLGERSQFVIIRPQDR
jgi:hypothetical protein